MRVLSSIFPFARVSDAPKELLKNAGFTLVENPVGKRMTESDIIAAAEDVDAIICGTEPMSAAVIAAAPRLKVIARVGSGYDSVDLDAAKDRDIRVTIVPDGPVESVAELTLALVMEALRGIGKSDRALRKGEWTRPMGRLLSGRVVGIAGVSHVGRLVAKKLTALGCDVLGHDIAPKETPGIRFVDKSELLQASDILLIHLAANETTQNWIGAKEIASMKQGAIIVNTARGGIVDEHALLEALQSGHLSHASMDVFETEPYTGPLSAEPNVTMTAHIGSMTNEARLKMEFDAAQSVVDVLVGRAPKNALV